MPQQISPQMLQRLMQQSQTDQSKNMDTIDNYASNLMGLWSGFQKAKDIAGSLYQIANSPGMYNLANLRKL